MDEKNKVGRPHRVDWQHCGLVQNARQNDKEPVNQRNVWDNLK